MEAQVGARYCSTGTLAFLSYMNHSKLIPLPIMFHVMDKLYAHIFAITYAITSTWYTFTTRNMLFILSLAIGLLSSAVYYFKLLPHVCVHIGVVVEGIVYILALSQVKSNNKKKLYIFKRYNVCNWWKTSNSYKS